MTNNDKYYLQKAISEGFISGRCLEVGSALEWSSIIPKMKTLNFDVCGLDINDGKYVDFIINLESEYETIKKTIDKTFDTIICFNTIEHVFNPVLVLENLTNSSPLISDLSNHIINSGGKRIRPLLTLAVSKLFDYQGNKDTFLADAIEYIH